ncbi:MAG: TIGR02710 family CRISPR-associated CARF protein [candidate division WOR-3 bacterium]
MRRLFIATVGIGRADEDIIPPLTESIREASPDFLLLLVTQRSKPKGEEIVKNLDRSRDNYQIHPLSADEWDVEALFKEMYEVVYRLIKERAIAPQDVICDFTTGTKPMSAALAFVAVRLGLGRLKYIKVRRNECGYAVSGTERTITFEPHGFQASLMLRSALELMYHYRFDSVLQILEGLQEGLLNEPERRLKQALTKLAYAYAGWDLFDHCRFASNYRQAEPEKIPELADFMVSDETVDLLDELGRKGRQGKYCELMVVDLLNNARRRIEEGKYDDALARLYRTCELIAQLRLRARGIDNSNVELDKVPEKSRRWLENYRTREGRIEIGLAKSYQLLTEMDDELGKRFTGDPELQAILNERNYYILAHGCKPIAGRTAEKLLEKVEGIAKSFVAEFQRKRELLKFPWSRF